MNVRIKKKPLNIFKINYFIVKLVELEKIKASKQFKEQKKSTKIISKKKKKISMTISSKKLLISLCKKWVE